MNRRQVLGLIGGGVGVAGVGGYLYLRHGQNPEELNNLERPSPEEELESVEKPSAVPDTNEEITFVSEPISEPVTGSDEFERIEAEPSDQGNGDRVRLDMSSDVGLSEEAEKIRLMLDLETDETIESDVGGETVTFQGEGKETGTVLVGEYDGEEKAVLLVRAESMDAARGLVGGWESL